MTTVLQCLAAIRQPTLILLNILAPKVASA
jgi:hypothetical protein